MQTFPQRWIEHWALLELAPDGACLERLMSAYGEPVRHYHTRQHLAECLDLFGEVAHLAARPGEVAIALWFHDAVYVPKAGDNEERSADWAAAALHAAGAAPDVAARVHAMIMATAQHGTSDDCDTQLVIDIDLAILGAAPARFGQYAEQIRAEYAAVPDAAYAVRRRAVLAGFLARPALYATPALSARLEQQARRNLEQAVAAG